MINRITPFLNQLIPAGIAAKGLEKVDSRLGKFVQRALASGYTIDAAMDFLRNNLGEDNQRQSELQRGQQSGTLRPDEEASLQMINESQQPQKLLGTAATLGGAALGGGLGAGLGLAGQALEGNSGQLGQSPDPSGQMQQPEQMQEEQSQAQDPLETLSGYSPELVQFIREHIQAGRTPEQAAALARIPGKFEKVVKRIEKDTKENFVDYLQRLFGNAKPQQEQTQQSGQQSPGLERLLALLQQRNQG